MKEFTIVISDAQRHDQGWRGTRAFWWMASHVGAYAELGLYWFLTAYFGRSAVKLLRPSELLASSETHHTNWLFVGLPTSLSKEHLRRIKHRRMVLYDSTDMNGVHFAESDKATLLGETDLCLKNWRDRRWRPECRIGLLPIKRPPINNKLRAALRLASVRRRMRPSATRERPFDIGYVARPTGDPKANPRVRWLLELKSQRPELKLWGGLVGGDGWKQSCESMGDRVALESCWLDRRKVSFFEYFAGLCRSKVALAPGGYAPWTYRHLEALYARCVVVSNDHRHYEFLVPFPRHGMIEAPDGESVVPAIDAAMTLREQNPDVVDANLQELEDWLDCGAYSRKRRPTVDRFFAQLDAA